jgi:hypothetical protein
LNLEFVLIIFTILLEQLQLMEVFVAFDQCGFWHANVPEGIKREFYTAEMETGLNSPGSTATDTATSAAPSEYTDRDGYRDFTTRKKFTSNQIRDPDLYTNSATATKPPPEIRSRRRREKGG